MWVPICWVAVTCSTIQLTLLRPRPAGPAWSSAPYFDGHHLDVAFSVGAVCAFVTMPVPSLQRAERFTLGCRLLWRHPKLGDQHRRAGEGQHRRGLPGTADCRLARPGLTQGSGRCPGAVTPPSRPETTSATADRQGHRPEDGCARWLRPNT